MQSEANKIMENAIKENEYLEKVNKEYSTAFSWSNVKNSILLVTQEAFGRILKLFGGGKADSQAEGQQASKGVGSKISSFFSYYMGSK
jgi:hypothetical protein